MSAVAGGIPGVAAEDVGASVVTGGAPPSGMDVAVPPEATLLGILLLLLEGRGTALDAAFGKWVVVAGGLPDLDMWLLPLNQRKSVGFNTNNARCQLQLRSQMIKYNHTTIHTNKRTNAPCGTRPIRGPDPPPVPVPPDPDADDSLASKYPSHPLKTLP